MQVLSAVKPSAGSVKTSSLPPQPNDPLSFTHAVTPTPPDSLLQQHSHQQQSDAVMPEAVQSCPQLQMPSRSDYQPPPTSSMPLISSILKPPKKTGLACVMQPDSQGEASAAAVVSEAGNSLQERGLEAVADTVMTGDAEVIPQQKAKAADTVMSEASGLGHQLGCHVASSGRGMGGSSHSQQGQLPSEQGGEPFKQGELPVEQGELPIVADQLSNQQSQLPIDQRQLPTGLSQLPIKQSQVPCEPCCSRTPEASDSLSRAAPLQEPFHSDHHLSGLSLPDCQLPDCAHDGRCCEQSHGSKAAAEKVTSMPPQSDADCVAAGGCWHQPEAVAGSPAECIDADSSARGDNRAARDSPSADHRPAGTDSGGLCPVGVTTYTEVTCSLLFNCL